MKKKIRSILFSSAVGLTLGCLSSPIFACGNGVEHELFPEVDVLSEAETELRSGNLERAARLAVQVAPNSREKKYVSGLRPLRAARVMALVMVRSEGAWLKGGRLVLPEEKERTSNLDWAVTQLRLRSENAPKTASYRVDLGEALERVPRHHSEARNLLAILAKAKLVHSPHAFAALARLHAQAGDASASAAATDACEKRARDKSICKMPESSAQKNDEKGSKKA